MAVNKSERSEVNRVKQMGFVSRLTFIRGLKDVSKNSVYIKDRKRKKFRHWCMPSQPTGYIKCRQHDFL
jgi:hypothetical protein